MVAAGERCTTCGGPLELSPEPQWVSPADGEPLGGERSEPRASPE
jgi:hypothetical protein